jgi:undecaprenyl-diphosphatase
MIDRRNQYLPVTFGLCFSVLLILVLNGKTNTFDIYLRDLALNVNTPTLVTIWQDISVLGSVPVISSMTIFSLVIYALQRNRWAVRHIALAMCGAAVFDVSIKWLVHRPRPAEVYANTLPSTFSFPSGHALSSFMFYFAIVMVINRHQSTVRPWLLLVAAGVGTGLIGASRVFLSVHYGSDVLGGYLIAATWLSFLVGLKE